MIPAELVFGALVTSAAAYTVLLGYTVTVWDRDPASWALMMMLVLLVGFPWLAVVLTGFALGIAFGVRPLQSPPRLQALLKWTALISLGGSLLVVLTTLALKVHDRCSIGF